MKMKNLCPKCLGWSYNSDGKINCDLCKGSGSHHPSSPRPPAPKGSGRRVPPESKGSGEGQG